MWPDYLGVGIKEIDEEHKAVLTMLSELEAAIERRDDWHSLHLLIARLEDLVRIHFRIEEALMGIHDYPHLQEHQHEHYEHAATLAKIREWCLKEALFPEMIASLREWWLKHITDRDADYAAHFLQRQALGKRKPA